MQKILKVVTGNDTNLVAKAQVLLCNDTVPQYTDIKSLLENNWKLLAPPKSIPGSSDYEWWFVKD